MRGAVRFPSEHEYVEKYEDAVCYNYFSEEFNTLYEGIVVELDVWDRIKKDVRGDLPKALISRIVSVQCSVYIRYMNHHDMPADAQETNQLIEASVDSIWRSIARISS